MPQTLHKMAKLIFSGQFGRLFSAIGERMPAWLFRSGQARLFELDNLADHAAEMEAAANCGEYRIAEVPREGLAACAAAAGHPATEFLRRHEHGDRCFAAFLGEQPVHVTWVCFSDCYIRGLSLFMPRDNATCYLYGVFTVAKHRGKGVFKRVHQEITKQLASRGISRIIAVVMDDNHLSAGVFKKLGYQAASAIHHKTICGIKKSVISDFSGGSKERQLCCRPPAGVYWI